MRRKDSSELPVILVTGCGSGIGYELAHQLSRSQNYQVIATARSTDSLRRLKLEFPENKFFHIYKLDITQKAEREKIVAEILHKWKSIDVLINNAGISFRSVVEHMDEESEFHQMDVNYLSPMALIRLVIPSMRERGSGKIINVSSVSGFVAMPTMSSYAASKHALEGATEALWYELRPFGIEVSLVQPGFVSSKSFDKIYFSRKADLSKDIDGPYSEYYQYMATFVERFMFYSMATPAKIARKIIFIMQKRRMPLWCPVSIDAYLFYFMRKVFPRDWFHRIMYQLLPQVKMWGRRGEHKSIFSEQLGNQDFLRSQLKQKNLKSYDVDERRDYQSFDR